MLQVCDVRRTFRKGEIVAVDGVSLEINAGQIHALLGPNGAGKTTTVKMIAGLLEPSGGSITMNGQPLSRKAANKQQLIGLVLGGELGFYGRVSARDNLLFFADLKGLRDRQEQVDHCLAAVNLADASQRKVQEFSRGMVQRLHIARALLGDPQLLVLDEPTSGLDPDIALVIRELIGQLKKQGKAVLLTSHTLAEVEALADQITVIAAGKVQLRGGVADIRAAADVGYVTTVAIPVEHAALKQQLAGLQGVSDTHWDSGVEGWKGTLTWRADIEAEQAQRRVSRLLAQTGADTAGVFTRPASLEEAYVAYIRGRQDG